MKSAILLPIFLALMLSVVSTPSIARATEGTDRLFFVDDGGFEIGACGEGSAWTCATDTECANWIIDPMAIWGVPAHDGQRVAQLGGSCGKDLNSNSFCQEFAVEVNCLSWITFRWLGIVKGSKPGTFHCTVDGEPLETTPEGVVTDTGGLWQTGWFEQTYTTGIHTFCFEFVEGRDESVLLLDTVNHPISPTPVLPLNLSTVKRFY